MHIIIDNKEAVLKKGSSFDYIIENRFFTGADSYSLSMTFPLRGCQENIDIFGYINRKDCDLENLLLDCEIIDKNFYAHGAVNIVEISESEVKTQFLVGKSVRNYVSELDDIYINELSIGPSTSIGHSEAYRCWLLPSNRLCKGFVCLPWVNNTSGNMQNELISDSKGVWYFKGGEDVSISCQYYLICVLERVLDACGYDYDLSSLHNSFYEYLVVFNTFPCAWNIDEWGLALPHWTVTEFLEQVEYFTHGEFIISTERSFVRFRFNKEILDEQAEVNLSSVLDEHQVEISEGKNKNTYVEQAAVRYAEADHHMQKYYSCPWAPALLGRMWFGTISNLLSTVSNFLVVKGDYMNVYMYKKLLYAADIDTYFVLKCYKVITDENTGERTHHMRLWPVNVYAPSVDDNGDGVQFKEIGIVPVCIDHCGAFVGDCVFLECGSYGESEEENPDQTQVVNMISNGEPEKKEEYYDKLYVGFWDGTQDVQLSAVKSHYYPIPWIDNYWVSQENILNFLHGDEQEDASMRLRGQVPVVSSNKHRIDQTIKYTFSFLLEDGVIPNVQSVFCIHGKKYLAEKITATFSGEGISQLVKMVAYRIIDTR